MKQNKFETEWCVLQNQFDSYEKHSLYIKLVSIVALLAAEIFAVVSIHVALVLAVLWLQDGIWKTFQSRIEPRLLQLESAIAQESSESEFQFNSEYQKVSLSGLSLIGEYVRQSVRPTVAFPHVVLILLVLAQCVL
ncbi:MAG: hypothetical protein ACI9JM_001585 [Halioglobus sp.]|jgi:hypothetical protein